MAITAPTIPNTASVATILTQIEGSALDNLMESGQSDWSDKITQAGIELSFDLRNRRGLDLALISTKDADGATNNVQADLDLLTAYLTLELIFRDALDNVDAATAEQYREKADLYRQRYDAALEVIKLDYDLDESGAIGEDEEGGTIRLRFSV